MRAGKPGFALIEAGLLASSPFATAGLSGTGTSLSGLIAGGHAQEKTIMASKTGTKQQDGDWSLLKGVAVALWVTAGLVLLAVQFALPRDHEIVVSSKPTSMKLAGSAAR